MRISLVLTLINCLAAGLLAQTPKESFAIRAQGGLNLSIHSADFAGNGDVIDCGQLTSGSGINPVLQGVLEFPITEQWGMGLALGYAGRSATLARENTYPIRDGATGQEGTLVTDLKLQSTLSYLEIQPDFRMPLIGTWSQRTLGLIAGPRVSLPLTTSFVQHEVIVAPSNATFNAGSNRTQDRTIASGPITTRSSLLVGASVGLESFIPLSTTIAFVPAFSADYFVSSIVNDASWHTFGVRLEAGLRFAFFEKVAPPKKEVIQPPPPPPAVIVTPVSIAITKPTFTGEVVTGNKLHATTPIVNAVFFDSTSSQIPASYKLAPDGYGMSADPVQAHNWIMLRVATVLKNNPRSSVLLEGSGDATLGLARAEAVKHVLQTLGVATESIETHGRQLPKIPSNADFAGGREENNRVDIFVKNAPLQEWVTTEQFAQLRGTVGANVTRVGGAPELRDSGNIQVRIVSINNSTREVPGNTGTVTIPIEEELRTGKDTVVLQVEAESYGAMSQYPLSVTISTLPHRSIDVDAKNFKAVLRFDYNSAVLTPEVEQLLRQLVAKLPKGSVINIEGSADALGSAERNKKLSDERAQRTQDFVQTLSGNTLTVTIASTNEHFSDDTPQGRFLNRSIRISVYTP